MVFGVITGIFLPVRLVFYTYFASHWIGSLGLVSSFMLAITFLAHKNKLGKFGSIFVAQMTKTMNGKAGLIGITLSAIFLVYLVSTLVWIERGNTVYSDEKKIVSQMIFSGFSPNPTQIKSMAEISRINQNGLSSGFLEFDKVASLTYAIMNDMMRGWLVSLDTILIIEQLEVLGLILFYKKVCINYLSVNSQMPIS